MRLLAPMRLLVPMRLLIPMLLVAPTLLVSMPLVPSMVALWSPTEGCQPEPPEPADDRDCSKHPVLKHQKDQEEAGDQQPRLGNNRDGSKDDAVSSYSPSDVAAVQDSVLECDGHQPVPVNNRCASPTPSNVGAAAQEPLSSAGAPVKAIAKAAAPAATRATAMKAPGNLRPVEAAASASHLAAVALHGLSMQAQPPTVMRAAPVPPRPAVAPVGRHADKAATALKGLMTNASAAAASSQQSAYTRGQRATREIAATPSRRTAAVSCGPAAANTGSNQKPVAAYIPAQHGRMPSSRAATHRYNNHAIAARDVSAAYATAALSGLLIPGRCNH
eukprot:jgi/Chrzof1/14961/Cz09g22100.t1